MLTFDEVDSDIHVILSSPWRDLVSKEEQYRDQTPGEEEEKKEKN